MRGCLFIVAAAAVVLGTVAWIGSPIVASTVISGALQNAGYHAKSSTVTATSSPPLKLLIGRADRVEIAGTDVDFRTFHAASLDLVLTDVDVINRTAGQISGRIKGVELTTIAGDATSVDVDIDGAGDAANAVIFVDALTVTRVVKATFLQKLGVAIGGAELVAPDIVRITAGGVTVDGRLVVDSGGAVAFSTSLGSSPILSLDPSFPLLIHSVRIEAGSLRIDAVLDAGALLGG